MATFSSSPPPQPPPSQLTPSQRLESDNLSSEILKLRAELSALTARQSLLSSTLLASTSTQTRLRQEHSSNPELTQLLNEQSIRSKTSAHRLAFGVTSFPFVDPSPDTSNTRLLGVRLDICKRTGVFEAPYYVLLKRHESSPHGDEAGLGAGAATETERGGDYRVHRHTLPALVPLQQYEERYLPLADEGYGSEDSVLAGTESGRGQKQDLHGFVVAVRNDLTSWQMRKEAVELTLEKLQPEEEEDDDDEGDGGGKRGGAVLKYGIQALEAPAVDAKSIRIVWRSGMVGRVMISQDGLIQKAAVFAMVGNEQRRNQAVENVLLSESGRAEDLIDRLKALSDSGALS
jgi:central kinetochore subunit Mal2/MCM21